MELLRKVSEFTNKDDRLHIYKMFVRSALEKSCVVWHSSITKKNSMDLERVQKTAVKIITNGQYSYKEGLEQLELPTLKQRREFLTTRFAKKCISYERAKDMFEKHKKEHKMTLRKTKKI